MNILNENYDPLSVLTPEIQINQIKNDARSIYNRFYNGVKYSTELFWNNTYFTPQQMVNAAGNSAAELFHLHTLAIQTLEQAVPGSTSEITSLIKPHTVNQDGTVTIL